MLTLVNPFAGTDGALGRAKGAIGETFSKDGASQMAYAIAGFSASRIAGRVYTKAVLPRIPSGVGRTVGSLIEAISKVLVGSVATGAFLTDSARSAAAAGVYSEAVVGLLQNIASTLPATNPIHRAVNFLTGVPSTVADSEEGTVGKPTVAPSPYNARVKGVFDAGGKVVAVPPFPTPTVNGAGAYYPSRSVVGQGYAMANVGSPRSMGMQRASMGLIN